MADGRKLSGGHSQSILCTSVTSDGKLISGGECGEMCIWSMDTLASNKFVIGDGDQDITSIFCSKQNSHSIYVACGTKVLSYDLRNMESPVYTFNNNEDEINQIVLNEKEEYLAACDDSGHIRIFNIQDRRLFKTLRKHSNICYSIAFRPGRKWDLLSGGLDCMLLQWDFSRSRSYCNIDMQDFSKCESDLPDSYLVSPPFIYSVDVSRDGEYTACGMENAQISIFNSSKKTLSHKTVLRKHTSGVSQVHFLNFADRLLASGGNDRLVHIWDINELESQPLHNGHAATNGHDAAITSAHCEPKLSIVHSDKINWMTSLSGNNQRTLVVADNSNSLTLYDIGEL